LSEAARLLPCPVDKDNIPFYHHELGAFSSGCESKSMQPLFLRALCFCSGLAITLARAQSSSPTLVAQPKSISASPGATVTLRVTASPATGTTYQWKRFGVDLPGATNATLVFTNIQMISAGDYLAVAGNAFGAVTSNVAAIQIDPTFFKVTAGPVAADGGESSGALWCDFDKDGFADLWVGNNPGKNALYKNNGDGSFTKLTNAIPAMDSGYGGAWGDYNNDGWPDLFVANGTANYLYRNNGDGTFTKVAPFAASVGATSWSGSWADYDRDGWLDLFIANGGGNNDFLLRNNHDGTFTKIVTTPLSKSGGTSIGSAWSDFDRDGWPDLFVANNGGQNFLFRNLGDGGFARITTGPIAVNSSGAIIGDWGDYDGDGLLDLAVGAFGKNRLYRNNGDNTFTQQLTGAFATDSQMSELVQWGDYDNDGWLDIFSANDGGQNNTLYHNNGDGTFSKVTTGSPVNDGGSSAGGSWTDYDNDGFLDLFIANWKGSGRNFLYRNAGNENRWLKVRCVGSVSNRSAIGARISVTARIPGVGRTQVREISGGIGFGQLDLLAHFGLGDAGTAKSIWIEWPSGTVQTLDQVDAKQRTTPDKAIATRRRSLAARFHWRSAGCLSSANQPRSATLGGVDSRVI
jgi:hypothetical protein